jgi:hypothetical protein
MVMHAPGPSFNLDHAAVARGRLQHLAPGASMFDVNTTVRASFGSPLDNHVYQIDAVAGQRLLVTFEWPGLGGSQAYVWLYADGRWTSSAGNSDHLQTLLQPTSDGGIVLELDPTSYGSVPRADYRLVAVTLPQDDHPAGGDGLARLSLGQALAADFDIAGDIDSFALTLEEGTSYLVTLTPSGSDPLESQSPASMVLLDPEGYSSYGYGSTLLVTASASGLHRLSATADQVGQYTLSVEVQPTAVQTDDDHGNDRATATPLRLDTPLAGRIDGPADRDVFVLQAEVGERLLIRAETTGVEVPSFRVFDAQGRFLGDSSSITYGITAVTIDSPTAQPIQIELTGQVGEGYRISAKSQQPDDHADTAQAATLLLPGRTVTGLIDSPSDDDLFALDLLAGQQVSLISGVQSTDGYWVGYPQLSVTAPNGYWVDTLVHSNRDGAVQNAFVAPADGRYVLDFYNSYGAVGYELTAVVASNADDHSGSVATATPLSLSTSTPGRLDHGADVDSFTFEARADTAYVVMLSGLDSQLWQFHGLSLMQGGGYARELLGADAGPLGNTSTTFAVDGDGPVTLQLFGRVPDGTSDYALTIVPFAGKVEPVVPTSTVDRGLLAVGLGQAGRSLIGSAEDDRLEGSPGDDALRGGLGNDVLVPGLGSDRIDGGAGTDSLIVAGSRADYRIEFEPYADRAGSGWLSSLVADQVDTLDSIERLRFDDGWTALSFDPKLATVATLIAALFGADTVHTDSALLLEGLRLADAGLDAIGLAAAALASDRFQNSGIGDSDAELLATLGRHLPSLFDSELEKQTWLSALDAGSLGRAEALALLQADVGPQDLINLIGSPLDLWIPVGP